MAHLEVEEPVGQSYEGVEAPARKEFDFRVVALISTFNEGDVIEHVVAHLVKDGIEVYLLDNHSTDDTVERVRGWLGRGLIAVESFPDDEAYEREGRRFAWESILARKLVLARELEATWFIHHDADEFRESPWPEINLRDAIHWVDRLGYNAIDFRLLNFPPVDDGFRPGLDPKRYFTRYEEGAEYDQVQIKCWKAKSTDVSMIDGGHEVRFANRRVCPIPFILRHYPIRGQTHGMRKVMVERKGRFLESELLRGWHVQYNVVRGDNHVFLRNPASLKPFDLDRIRLKTMIGGRRRKRRGEPVTPPNGSVDSQFEGFLDYVGYSEVVGWAWNGQSGSEPVSVDIWDGSRLLGTVRANQFRADLLDHGKGNGHAGFVFKCSPGLADGRPHTIWVNLSGTSRSLGRSPWLLAASASGKA